MQYNSKDLPTSRAKTDIDLGFTADELFEELLTQNVLPLKQEGDISVVDFVAIAKSKGAPISNSKARKILRREEAAKQLISVQVREFNGRSMTVWRVAR